MAAAAQAPFKYPDIWNLPPFFTLQRVLNTRAKQVQLWANLILDFTRHFKVHEFDVLEMLNTCPLFHNKSINRKLPIEALRVFLDFLEARGNAKWLDKEKKAIRIIWRTDDEWANIIYKYVLEQHMIDTVCTLYELREGDKVEGEEFYQLDISIFSKALGILEKRGVAKVFSGSTRDTLGVKFFAAK